MDPKFNRWLVDAFNIRITGDYNVDKNISVQIVVNLIHQAREFLEAAQKYLGKRHT